MPLLELRDVDRRFGGILALDSLSVDVDAGEIVGLIGPNGAGKTTAFNVITRLYRPDAGDIVFDGHSLLGLGRTASSRSGSRARSERRALPDDDVRENVLVGSHARAGAEPARAGSSSTSASHPSLAGGSAGFRSGR